MTISTEMVLFIITILAFLGTGFGAAAKYGADMQQLRSKNDWQDDQFRDLKDRMESDKAKNYEQHKEFYAHKEASTKMEKDVEYIMKSLDEIKGLLEKRRGTDI